MISNLLASNLLYIKPGSDNIVASCQMYSHIAKYRVRSKEANPIMRLQYFIPAPGYPGYTCYPKAFGHYLDAGHAEHRREGQCREFNLHLALGGKGFVCVNQRWIALQGGDGFLYSPGQVQQYRADPLDPWDIRWIHFVGHDINHLLSGRSMGEVWLFSFAGQERFVDLTNQLFDWGNYAASSVEPKLSALVYEILAELARHAVSLQGHSLFTQHDKIRSAADYIRSHCAEPLTLSEMAEVAGYSVYYFNRLFRQIMGKTPYQYAIESRLLMAKQLLTASSLSVKQIGYACGFAQTSHFIHMFRRSEGLAPQQFRLSYSGRK
jgi:AraC-like DNA-binding protein